MSTQPAVKMTKAAATAAAVRKLQYGHYAEGSSALYTQCPECGARVERQWFPGDKFLPMRAGHPMALRAALVSHLMSGECER